MKTALFAIFLCFAGPAARAYQDSATRGSIEGQVVNPTTGAPVRNATVTMNSSSNRGMRPGQPIDAYNSVTVDADEQGRFAFRDLAAGGYQLRAQRRGAQGTPGSAATFFVGERQQLKGVTLKLASQAVIAGKVVDQEGEPVQNAQVSLVRSQSVNGRDQWMTTASAQTTDLGEYRIPVPVPGMYLVSAYLRDYRPTSVGQSLPEKPELRYVATYYPSAVDVTQAGRVAAGTSEVRNIEIKLQRVPTVHIRGRVVDPSPASNRTPSLNLRSRNNPAMTQPILSFSMGGDFEFAAVPAGSYTLSAQKYLSENGTISSSTPMVSASATLEVSDKSIDGLTLKLEPGKEVQGSIKVEGDFQVPPMMQVTVTPVDGFSYGPAAVARNISGNVFTLKNVTSVPSTVNASLSQQFVYLKSVRYGGREIPPGGVDLTTGETLQLIVANDGGRLEGTVSDSSGKPVRQASVAVFAIEGALTRFIMMNRTDDNGEFRISMLRPGTYKVVAIQGLIDMSLLQSSELLKAVDSRAKTVTLEALQTVRVSLIPVSSTEAPGIILRPDEHPKGSVEGRIVDSKTGLPVSGAAVSLGNSSFVLRRITTGGGEGGVLGGVLGGSFSGAPTPPGLTAETDEQGRFVFRDVEPAVYQLGAMHQGFVSATYGTNRNFADAGLVVGEGQSVRDIGFKLAPQAVIAGKVLDEDGNPMERVRIVLLKRSYSKGRPRFTQIPGMVQTDDRGEYRVSNLSAGAYIIGARVLRSATVTTGALPEQTDMAYPATFFPNTLDAEHAKVVTLEPGFQMAGVDVAMRRSPLWRIRGKVVDKSGPLPSNYSLTVWPKGGGTVAAALAPVTPRNAQGEFEIRDLTPGAYIVMVRAGGGTAQQRVGARTVELRDRNVEDVTLELGAGSDVSGTVVFEDKTSSNFGVYATLISADGAAGVGQSSGYEGNTITFHNVPPIPYLVDLSSLPPTCNCYVSAVRYGGSPIPESGAILTTGQPLEIVVSAKAATVEGTVVDSKGRPVPNAALAILPRDGNLAQLKVGIADGRGRFYWPGNSAGEYELLAWEDIDVASLEDPALLRPFHSKAKIVKLDPAARLSVQLTAIP